MPAKANSSVTGKTTGRIMMRRLLTVLAIVGSLVLLNTHTWSHHAFSSEFDIDKPISLRGTITRMEWVNPHTWLHMTANIEDDTIQ